MKYPRIATQGYALAQKLLEHGPLTKKELIAHGVGYESPKDTSALFITAQNFGWVYVLNDKLHLMPHVAARLADSGLAPKYQGEVTPPKYHSGFKPISSKNIPQTRCMRQEPEWVKRDSFSYSLA